MKEGTKANNKQNKPKKSKTKKANSVTNTKSVNIKPVNRKPVNRTPVNTKPLNRKTTLKLNKSPQKNTLTPNNFEEAYRAMGLGMTRTQFKAQY